MKRFFSLLISVFLSVAVLCILAYADPVPATDTIRYSAPEKTDTGVLKAGNWNGKSALKPNTCYFVEGKVTVNRATVIPESSMLVIRNGALLRLGAGARLYVKGAVAIHSDGKLNVAENGILILKSTSVMVNNGTLAISKGGKVLNYGYLQSQGIISLKGSLKTLKSGTLACADITKKSTAAVLSGKKSGIDKRPLYMVQELESYEGEELSLFDMYTGEGSVISDKTTAKKLLRSFESVLYMYSGEMGLNPGEMVCDVMIDYQYQQFVEISEHNSIICGISEWGGIPIVEKNDWDNEELSGCFYQAVLGKPDRAFFTVSKP